jgi:hypothetical protein
LDLELEQQLRETNEVETWVWAFRGAEWADQAGSASGARLLFQLNFGNH